MQTRTEQRQRGQSLEMLCRRLPPFPPLANQLIELFSSADACIHQAEMLIRSDGVFSGELLRLANSAEFSTREPFDEVAPAILFLGFERVRSVIRRVTYARLMKDEAQHPFSVEIHRANVASAFICERLFKAYGKPGDTDGFCPYSLGLYLKIGASALLRAFPREFPRFLYSHLESEAELLRQEAERFGHHHIALSEFLVKQWGFPEGFHSLVAGHGRVPKVESPLSAAGAAALAWRLAGSLGFTFLKGLKFAEYEELRALLPGAPRVPLPRAAEEWRAAITEHLESLKVGR
ncbi:MAG: HDOD domain-containing protein [Bryobacterales bacterium]|nr:HDOD domain-containing protein [Bryobacterales bacterium]